MLGIIFIPTIPMQLQKQIAQRTCQIFPWDVQNPSGPSLTKKETRTVFATNVGTLLFNVAYFRQGIWSPAGVIQKTS